MSIRRRMMAALRIEETMPYQEIEYLESSGTQWIEIPMPKGEIISFKIEFKSPKNVFICGSWNSTAASYPSFSLDGYNRLFATDIATSSKTTLNYGFIENTDISLAYRNGVLTTNGVQKYTNRSLSADYNGTFILFGVKVYGSTRYLANGLKLKKFKVKTVNGSIDLISVRESQVGYMYDKVSGQLFGNSGTNTFILGNDVN